MDRFEEAKAKIKEAIDLVALVESYLPLKRSGRNMMGLCPFHAEKTPSFTVSPATQHYKCFGCNKAGDVFSFMMEREGLDFRTAFEMLAQRAGVPIDGVLRGGGNRDARTAASQVLAAVNAFFQASLQSAAGAAARAYLETRGLMAAAEAFGLGFHPAPGELLRFCRSRNLPLDVVQAAGLLGRDGRYEPFSGRVMFPILDETGRIVGFGGRVLAKGQEPKYLNSPESPFFNKRRILFGLRQVKERGVRRVLVVEGYTDVIACHLAGFAGAVATLGTSLTAEHARLLQRYATEGVVLLFDGDRAGRQAAERALRELTNVELTVRIAFMDDGVDPADLVQVQPGATAVEADRGRERLTEIIAAAEDAMVAWFRLLRLRYDFSDEIAMARAAQECANLLGATESPVRREAMIRRMAAWFGGDEAALRRLIKRPAGSSSAAEVTASAASPPPPRTGQRAGGTSGGLRGPGPRGGRGGRFADRDRPAEPLRDADVAAMLGGTRAGSSEPSGPAVTEAGAASDPADRALLDAEVDVLACLLASPDLHAALLEADMLDARASRLLAALCAAAAKPAATREVVAKAAFSSTSGSSELASLLAEAVDRSHHIREPAVALAAVLDRRRRHVARREARRLRIALEAARLAGDQVKVDDLTRLFYEQLRQS